MEEMEQFNHKRTFAVAGVGVILVIIIVGVVIAAFFGSDDGKGPRNRSDSNAIIVSDIDNSEQQHTDTDGQQFNSTQYGQATINDNLNATSGEAAAPPTANNASQSQSSFGGIEATTAPAYFAPAQYAGEGCYFAEAYGGNTGLRVARGAALPPSSLFEPDFTQIDLHHFRDGGIAPESGVVWMFVDDKGTPASDACIFAQLKYFTGRNFIQH